MTFFVVLANTKSPIPFSKIVGLSFGLYIWFMISTRLRFDIWLILISILAVMYILKVYKENSDEELDTNTKERIENVEQTLFYIALGITIFGAILYLGEKKIEYGDTFQLFKFLFGHTKCKGASPQIGFLQAFKAAFK
jgi:Ca2+/Na+ antiporter